MDVALISSARDLAYLVIACTAFAFLLRWIIRLLGFPYAKIQEKLDDEPVAIAILFAGLSLALANLIGAILH